MPVMMMMMAAMIPGTRCLAPDQETRVPIPGVDRTWCAG